MSFRKPFSPPIYNSSHSSQRSDCGSGGIDKSDYDMPLHVGGLFIILFVLATAAGFPVLAAKVPGLKIPNWALFAMRHFGTGVIIGAAFIHLLPPAFVYLSNPCLGDFWVKDYPAISGVITMSSVFLVVLLEMLLHPACKAPRAQALTASNNHQVAARQVAVEEEAQLGSCCTGSTRVVPTYKADTSQQTPFNMNNEPSRLDSDGQDTSDPGNKTAQSQLMDQPEMGIQSARPIETMTPEQKHRWEILQCLLLELGILVHSVFIGMTLSVSIGNNFIVLLIAIIFHQLFEGLALGSRIADISWRDGAIQPWLMALAYGYTTPIGQAIGLATHTLYSPDSEIGLLVVGILSAISAGLLTFASLVELLAPDFLSDESWDILYGKARVYACLLVFFGAFLMSLVGAWA
ncbi:hypothetical protein LCI18_013008 [Fusarium solani-melongenae]|uniref:Uncharacterized protein n=1 Tax=Fusarium solani subsp. cucurbitae TaxID=2747967 RepID=A0ACD3ZLW3_FUSSC|nr:hypothetical protein LCI18_013008 [Fusarium solani-melongenae]